jgi:hypothetical protein
MARLLLVTVLRRTLLAIALLAIALLAMAEPALAQQRFLTIEATPTVRTQLAIWIESDDGERFATIRLTDAVAFRGLANRPGALQMNSGYHWPYGRREGVLPLWAHRRFEVEGTLFPRVVFADRIEGWASRSGTEEPTHLNTRDDYYCLSFTGGETLDAMSCASPFNSNKGRYLTEADVGSGYAEPWEEIDGSSARGCGRSRWARSIRRAATSRATTAVPRSPTRASSWTTATA